MKNSIVAIFSLLVLASCSKEVSKTNLHLTGNIKGLKNGVLYIQRVVDTSLVAIDTIKINGDSKFDTNIDIQSPEMLYLFLDRGVTNSLDNNIMFFAEAGIITIDTNLDSYIASAKITGSKNQEKYQEYQKINARFRDENLDLIQKKFLAVKNGKTKTLDSVIAKQENNMRRKYLFATNFAINNNDYEVAPYIALTDIYDINVKYLDTIQKSMTPKVAKSLYGKKLTEYLSKVKALK
jgi:hypothetical protein